MARTVVEFLGSLRAAVPLSKAADWDVVGLQVGDQSAAAERVAVTHEVTDAVLDELDNEDIDLLIAYHPLMLRKVNRILAGHGAVGRAYRLVRMGVSLAVVHTAFDIVPGGAADALASALGLSDPTGFGPLWPAGTVKVVAFAPEPDIDRLVTAMAEAGAGGIGSYSACSFRSQGTGTFLAPEAATPAVGRAGVFNHEPEVRVEMVAPKSHADRVVAALVAAHRYEEPAYDVVDVRSNAGFVGRLGRLETPVTLQTFAHRVGERLDAPVRVAGSPKRTITTVAVVPGSGSAFAGGVAGSADVIVTGDMTHHRAREALEAGVAIIDAGHTPTERPGLQALSSLVSGIAPDAVDMSHLDPNPWREL